MHQVINEPVNVLASFSKDKIIPLYFRWRNDLHKITKVNFVHRKKEGQDTDYFFHVSNSNSYYKLSYSPKSFVWKLDEYYMP